MFTRFSKLKQQQLSKAKSHPGKIQAGFFAQIISRIPEHSYEAVQHYVAGFEPRDITFILIREIA
jgi:hypothetical protein